MKESAKESVKVSVRLMKSPLIRPMKRDFENYLK